MPRLKVLCTIANIDADSGVLGLIDHGAGQSHLSTVTNSRVGALAAIGTSTHISVVDAHGVAILAPRPQEQK